MKDRDGSPWRLILASGSPRRRELLTSLGLEFEIRPADLDETQRDGESPESYVERLAREKSSAQVESGEVSLGADTIVVLDNQVLGKPKHRAEAAEMLGRLAGREHEVLTGVALSARHTRGLRTESEVTSTRVRFRELTQAQIDWYSRTGEPDDKAGAYAIQGLGALVVDSIEGNYTNVVGLPLPTVDRLLDLFGLDPRPMER